MDKDYNEITTHSIIKAIEKYKLPLEMVANIISIPLPTLKDKLAFKAPWKVAEVAKWAVYEGMSLDLIVFGDENYLAKLESGYDKKIRRDIYNYLVENKKYKTLGKLTAEGIFDDIIESDK